MGAAGRSRRPLAPVARALAYESAKAFADHITPAKQLGASAKMIEDHYGHINPVKKAEPILQGTPGWRPAATTPQVDADGGRVNAAAA